MSRLRAVVGAWVVGAGLLCGTGAMGAGLVAPPGAGSYSGEALKIELAPRDGGGFGGTITFRGTTYDATARAEGERLVGSFEASGREFGFELRRDEGGFAFVSGGRTYPVTREDQGNPFADEDGAADAGNPFGEGASGEGAGDGAGEGTDEGAGASAFADAMERRAASQRGEEWKTYRHPSGFQFRHPATWQVQAIEYGVLLTPPEQGTSAQGPTEVYLAVAEQAPGAQRPDEPDVVAYVNESVMQMLPFLRQTGRPEPVRDATHPSVVLTYEGRSPTGLQTRARAYVTIFQGWGVMFLAAGETPLIEKRDDAYRQIFVSIAKEAPEIDPSLVGLWKYSETYISGEFGGTYRRSMALRGDGKAFAGSRVMASLAQNSHDGIGVLGDNVSGDTGKEGIDDRGEWNADPRERILTINWSDGTSERWRYYVEGSNMLLKGVEDQSKRRMWRRGG